MDKKFIFIFDENTLRRKKLAPYMDGLEKVKCIESPQEFIEKGNYDKYFESTLFICLHDSFFNSKGIDSHKWRETIRHYSSRIKQPLVVFGGGITNVSISKEICYIPLKRFYDNFEAFYEIFCESREIDPDILAFGKNRTIEQALSIRARITYRMNHLDRIAYLENLVDNKQDQENFTKLFEGRVLEIKDDLTKHDLLEWLDESIITLLYGKRNNN